MAREKWASKLGFMLAAMGSAVGLGNIWRFSYVAGENGGGAFLLLYLGFVFLIGIPVLLSEFSIGRQGQGDVVGSYQNLAPKKPWYLAGYMGIASAFLILSFYSVVAGWSLYYLWNYINGTFWVLPDAGYGATFQSLISNNYTPLFWHALFMVFTILVVLTGVRQGIEKANKIFMPALAVMMIGLAIYSVSLDGAMEGLKFLFQPDWSSLTDPSVYLGALGQAFFSLSIGMGGMMTYGSYLSKKESLPSATVGIGIMDTVFAIISGIVIFPAVYAFGISPSSGPSLVFITLPGIFAEMPFGNVVGFTFFLLLSIASLSSAISILEVPVAYFTRKFNWSRTFSSGLVGSIMFVLGIFVSLGMGVWSGVTLIGENNIMDSMDYVASNIFLPLGGLVIAIFVGWQWKKDEAFQASDMSTSKLRFVWYGLIKFIAPLLIIIIFLQSVGLLGW
ncbi:sodium-dependent transporter [Pontibacillus yanchengensis]|uniref:Sodium-dependent transporter n=2 Tax=Pontibacillus yanchengensis TaxID=462910 RepID=A0ACC7VK71_9BACI|nr:sodium-dependent transporter [Pontibacillus yanchengensis]MYL35729.1 sodium-dependent transporter [Pontibacillus yanchengensis]MYL54554.1 sodium-dependent transporter [Pontibacillus yanchengensis]